jgi:hypothetical protein
MPQNNVIREGFTYFNGRKITLRRYYQLLQIPHKPCPECRIYYPYSCFKPSYKHGVKEWICEWCTKRARQTVQRSKTKMVLKVD